MAHDPHPRPATPPPPPWLWPAALLVLGSSALVLLLILLVLDRAFLVGAIRLSIALLVVALAAALAISLRWLAQRARRAGVITLQHGQPIDVSDLRALTQATAAATLASHYQVELARAEHSGLPALTHYSVRNDGGAMGAVAAPPILEVAAAPPPPVEDAPDLPELVARGQVRSDASLLAGFVGQNPAHIAMRACGFIAVGGQSRSGKTHTVALLVAQAALQGWDIALCDPFPHKADGLMALCQPLSGGLFRQAATPEEIARTIQLVDKIGRRRLNGERWERPLLLVIEEFSNLVIRGLLPAEVLDLLPAMAMAYAAVGVHAIIIGHEFSRALLGERYGATLRRACTHRLAHRLAPDAAELLLPSAAYARQVVELQPGRALFWGEEAPTLIAVPKISRSDLIFAARGRSPRPYAPWPTAPTMTVPPSPPPAPTPPASLDERIVAHLAQAGHALDGNAIATQLSADLAQVRNALTRLSLAGRVTRHGQPRSYTYASKDEG